MLLSAASRATAGDDDVARLMLSWRDVHDNKLVPLDVVVWLASVQMVGREGEPASTCCCLMVACCCLCGDVSGWQACRWWGGKVSQPHAAIVGALLPSVW
jgi:hypothetical protein